MSRQAHALSMARGFSLVEVLVALVVLSVGLLGLAGLQAEGLRGSSSAQYRFQAVRLIGDISDRMRANAAGLTSYVVTAAGAGSDSTVCAEVGSTDAANCSAAAMAAYDLFQWKRDLDELLPPDGNGTITASGGGTTNRFRIVVTWNERGDANTITNEVQF